MTSKPPSLSMPDVDDDDAFDTADDTLHYVFSPDEIREDMASRYMTSPEISRESDGATSTGSFFTSMSTLNDEPSTRENESPTPPPSPPSLELSLSSHFSSISLSTPVEEHLPDDSIDHQQPSSTANGNGYLNADEAHSSWSDQQENARSSSPDSPNESHTRQISTPASSTPVTEVHTPQTSISVSSTSVTEVHTPQRSMSLSSTSASEGSGFTKAVPSSPPASAPAATSFSLPAIPSHMDPPGSNYLVEKPRSHRPHRSTGPSVFEKVRSQTRPTFLPPKPKDEDNKHMADWQQMMKSSRLAADNRRKALQERRLAREKAIDASIHVWERDILPNWRVVYKNAELRKLWWRGIPGKLRAPLWESVVGNELALSKDHYRSCLSRANRALTSGGFPPHLLDMIEEDMSTTLPSLNIFLKETGPMYGDLKEMLCAWVVSRTDEGLNYTFGAARIAAMLLINMPSQQCFIVMRNLLERHCLRSFFGGEGVKDDVDAYCRIFDTMLADGMPKIYFNFKQHQISPSSYLPDWITSLFMDHLPFEACARVWDVLLLEGDPFLYRASLGMLGVLEPRLFFPEKKELLELLRGENKAAIEVAKREGRTLNGGRYEIYGVDEETLWERIDAMDGWWKDSTWTRLIHRELPEL